MARDDYRGQDSGGGRGAWNRDRDDYRRQDGRQGQYRSDSRHDRGRNTTDRHRGGGGAGDRGGYHDSGGDGRQRGGERRRRSRSRSSCRGRSVSGGGGAGYPRPGRGVGQDVRGAPKHAEAAASSLSSESSSRSSDSGRSSNQDEIIHFDWQKGMVLNSKYTLLKLLGDGTFGRVVLARDKSNDNEVAIKIIRDVKRYMENAKIEADILKDIRKADRSGTSGCAIMYETFTHAEKFYCLVFETLGTSLYDFLKENAFRGFLMQDIQDIAKQSMQALTFLHGQLHMTHTDLKPENILLQTTAAPVAMDFPREAEWRRRQGMSSNHAKEVAQYVRPASSRVKLIDFGNATYEKEHHSSIINTRQYRGPEVLLGLGWNERSDQWSIGCILMELYVGEQLFATHEELEHLALIERILGPIPAGMLGRSEQAKQDRWAAYDSRSERFRLCWPDRASSSQSERHVHSQRPLQEQVSPPHEDLARFCQDLLTVDPARRPSSINTLQHPFFNVRFND